MVIELTIRTTNLVEAATVCERLATMLPGFTTEKTEVALSTRLENHYGVDLDIDGLKE